MYAQRLDRVRAAMTEQGVDVLLVSVGADLPYLIGYEAMPLPRLTMLVIPRDADATLVIPRLEVARVIERPDCFAIRGWEETEDPIAVVAELCGRPGVAAIGDQTWARHLVDLMGFLPAVQWRRSVELVGPLRARKDAAEIAALQAAAAAADRVARQLQGGEIPLIGRTENEVSEDLSRRLIAEGHCTSTSPSWPPARTRPPHHHASERVIRAGEVVLCDFGGRCRWPRASRATAPT
ncbi:MAG: aminopeptidase P family N-terminal domain-containing protein [Acidimicrobiales bacterium]